MSFCKAEINVNWSNHVLREQNWDFCHQCRDEPNQAQTLLNLYVAKKETTQMKISWPDTKQGRLLKG